MSSREFAKGMAKAKENDFRSAIEHFTNAISDDESNVEYYAERAVAYLNSGQFDLSLFDMNRCVEFEPNNSYRYSCRAFLKAKMGDPDGAIIDYEIAVKLDPEDAIAYNNLGLAQEQKGYRDKAARSFERSNQLIGYDPNKKRTETASSAKQAAERDGGTSSGSRVAWNVLTKKESFKDFLRFIRNGFKLK
jgi:tetratricopeptide (TPR) repeat protein